jgi:hypothetical protein
MAWGLGSMGSGFGVMLLTGEYGVISAGLRSFYRNRLARGGGLAVFRPARMKSRRRREMAMIFPFDRVQTVVLAVRSFS